MGLGSLCVVGLALGQSPVGRGVMVHLSDPGGLLVGQTPVVEVRGPQGSRSAPLLDDGAPPDTTAGDGAWAGSLSAVVDLSVDVELFRDRVGGTSVGTGRITWAPEGERDLQIVLRPNGINLSNRRSTEPRAADGGGSDDDGAGVQRGLLLGALAAGTIGGLIAWRRRDTLSAFQPAPSRTSAPARWIRTTPDARDAQLRTAAESEGRRATVIVVAPADRRAAWHTADAPPVWLHAEAPAHGAALLRVIARVRRRGPAILLVDGAAAIVGGAAGCAELARAGGVVVVDEGAAAPGFVDGGAA